MSRGAYALRPSVTGAVSAARESMADAVGVTTAAGYIRHERVGGHDLTVKLMTEAGPFGPLLMLTSNGLPLPLRRRGRLVFALPGGGEYVSERSR